MYYSFSAYGFDDGLTKKSYDFSIKFFDDFEKRKNFSFLKLLSNEVDGDFDSFKISKKDLDKGIISGVIDNYRIMSSASFLIGGVVSAGLVSEKFSKINCLDITFPLLDDVFLMQRFFGKIDELIKLFDPNYAFLCKTKTAANAVLYPTFVNNVVVLRNEQPSLIFDYINAGGMFIEKMRMVYELNYLSEKHLDLMVDDLTLSDWIEQDEKRGQLLKFGGKSWKWIVPEEEVQKINNVLGAHGLLCSWSGQKNIEGS